MPALPGSGRTHHPVPLKCPSNLLLLSLALSPLSQRGKDLGHCELLLERFPKLAPLFEIKEERGPSLFSPFTHCNYSISSLSAIHWLSARPQQPGHRSARRTSPCFPVKDWNVLSAASAASRMCQSLLKKRVWWTIPAVTWRGHHKSGILCSCTLLSGCHLVCSGSQENSWCTPSLFIVHCFICPDYIARYLPCEFSDLLSCLVCMFIFNSVCNFAAVVRGTVSSVHVEYQLLYEVYR